MQETLPADKRYIQYLTSEDGIEIILTMLPFLAGRLHSAKASLHDNTFARVHGQRKEWEVVIWDDKVDFVPPLRGYIPSMRPMRFLAKCGPHCGTPFTLLPGSKSSSSLSTVKVFALSSSMVTNEIDDAMKALKEKKKTIQEASSMKKTKKQGEKEKEKHPDENELAGLPEDASCDVPEPSDLAGMGLAPVPATYAEQAVFLSAPMASDVGIQLEPDLEPILPPAASYDFFLEGNLDDYMYPF
ncbi:hypothetical protein FB451DRAFT_1185935 [Mycena latifolia]|nr:hypothetical protein FB451DRAFT_1185935 [Mycena latifolia]